MKVQMILVQAGIELAREIITAPATKTLILKGLCKISDGSLCPSHFDAEKGVWKDTDGEKPTVIVQATDPDGDETTLTCAVDVLFLLAKRAWDALWSPGKFFYPGDPQLKFFADPGDLGETASLWGEGRNSPVETLDQFEQLMENLLGWSDVPN